MYGVLWCRWSSSSLVSQHVSSLLYNESFFVVLCGRIHPWCWNSWYCVKSTLRKQPTFCDTSGFPSKPTSFPGFSPTSPYGARERGWGGGGRGVGERTWERGYWAACVKGVWNGRQREFLGAPLFSLAPNPLSEQADKFHTHDASLPSDASLPR